LWPTVAAAQTAQTTDYLGVSTKIVIGASGDVQSNFDQVLKVVGLPSVSGGASSAIGIDTSGNVRKDSGTTIDTSGHWFFSNWLYGPFTVATSTGADPALGFDNVRIHQNAGTPRVTWEDASSSQWTIDNASGVMRFYRTNSSGSADTVPFQLYDYLLVDPKAKAILPNLPYDINLGSPLRKFLSVYAAELNVETLVRQNIMATMGGRLLILLTTQLRADITSTQTTITVNDNNLANGDRVYMEGEGRVEFMAVGSGATLINLCPQSGSCATADTTTSWGLNVGTASLDRDHRWQGDASISLPNTVLNFEYFDGTTWMANATTYTIQLVMRRSDDGPIVPTGSSYQIYCSSVDLASSTVADDLGATSTGHWYRLHGTCTHSSGGSRAGVTQMPTGSVTHNIDAMQVEVGSTMTPWSQTAASYTVTRNLDGSGGNAWVAGTAVANTGQTGNGFIDAYSTRGVKAGTEIGPTLCGNVRLSSTYNDWAPRWCLGQLQGVYGYGSSTFGLVSGDSTKVWIAQDDVNGFRIMNGATQKFRAYASDGHLSISEGAVTIDDNGLRIDISTLPGGFTASKAYNFSTGGSDTIGYSTEGSGGTIRQSRIVNDYASGSSKDAYIVFEASGRSSGGAAITGHLGLYTGSGVGVSGNSAEVQVDVPIMPTASVALGRSGARWSNAFFDALNIGTGTVTINGTAAGDSGGSVTCPTGQAIKTINIRQGIVISLACGAP
jgi:hypothetical protein